MTETVLYASAPGSTVDASAYTTAVVLRGSSGDDRLIGGAGADRLGGGLGHNEIIAGAGNDQIHTVLTDFAYDSVDGGAGIDSLYITLSNDQYTPNVRLGLSALKTFITSTVVEDPAAHFSDAALHLDLTGVERAFIRLDGVVTDLAYFSLPEATFDVAPAKPLGGAMTVHATDSLYDYAGNVSGVGATLPVSVDLGSGTGRSVTLADVSGGFAFAPDALPTGPDGADLFGGIGTGMDPAAGLAGITLPNNGMLVGVFLDGHEQDPGHVAPAALDFGSIGEDFPSLAPAIDQPFFIGDGLDAAGAAQAFLVPDAARVLVLGILDGTAFHGSPDHYGDNTGFVTANVTVQDNVWGL
jgi:RTX calcium-binding nonapeptide repeat (4 copies)